MKKNYKSITCPECKSTDIDFTTVYQNETEKEVLYAKAEAIEVTKEKVMQCHCKDCNNEYSVNQGLNRYTVLKQPLSLTGSGDVKLISVYASEFDYDFKLIQMSPHNGKPITMALVENDQYPVILPKEQDIEKDLPKVKKILFNTWMNRYR